MNDAEKAWEIARFSIPDLDKPNVANAFGGELVNALRACFIRGFTDGRNSGGEAAPESPRPASETPKDGVYLGWIACKRSCYGGWWETVCYGNWDFYDQDDNHKDKQNEDGYVKGRGWYAEREGDGDTLIVPLDGGEFAPSEKLTFWLPLPPRLTDSGSYVSHSEDKA